MAQKHVPHDTSAHWDFSVLSAFCTHLSDNHPDGLPIQRALAQVAFDVLQTCHEMDAYEG